MEIKFGEGNAAKPIVSRLFNDFDMKNFATWINVRCELGDWQGQFIFKGKICSIEEIFKIYIDQYFEPSANGG